MKILFLVSSLSSGGAERVAATLCNAWVKAGRDVTLIATYSGGGGVFYDISPEVNVQFLAHEVKGLGRRAGYMGRLIQLHRMVLVHNPDVIVSFLSNVNVSAILMGALRKVPVIVCERNDPEHIPMSFMLRTACNFTYPRSDALVVQTEQVKAKIGRIFRTPNKVFCVPNPMPVGLGTSRQTCVRPEGSKILISVGRLAEQKQPELMIRSFSAIADKHPEWIFNLWGEGPLRARLETLIAELGLTDRVFLRGNTKEPWKIMAAADVFVMGSRFEGFPNALLEAMGMGMPCAVFDCESGPYEMTRAGKDALLVPANDGQALSAALCQLMGSAELRRSLGERARESVLRRYALPQVLAQWDEVFRAVGTLH